jgi:hypothetical protein
MTSFYRERKNKKGDPIFGKYLPITVNLETSTNMGENIEF